MRKLRIIEHISLVGVIQHSGARMLEHTSMKPPQAEALALIFAEMATKSDLAMVEARLTWRIIAIVGFFATVTTLLNAFIR